ncbi:unnamed protein product [Trifolium pratense]|uniref:Uncharacterized protein n=1 Tax=Trifolium pratense TaxID=57577 RepID=A0ACB0KYE3_TRIPR|nr:unnamed protein product [Trifolium pratense]
MAHPNLDGLSLHEEEEEEGLCFDFEEEGDDEQVELRWCLVGRFICERNIHFNSMSVRMADLWKPVRGVTIKEAKLGLFLFHFAHPYDMEAVLNGGPWIFDYNMLLLEQVQLGMQVDHIPLFHAVMWVQIHDLPMGLMKEKVGIGLANYIGSFVEYDKNNNTSFWRQFMRVRVKIDVRQPLKKDYKVKNKEGKWCTVNFKYEKLGVFCFVCGIMGHAENKCEVRYSMEQDDDRREWSADLRAEPKRQGGRQSSRWLKEDKGGREDQGRRDTVVQPNNQPGSSNTGPIGAELDPKIPKEVPIPNQPAIITRQNHSITISDKQPDPSIIPKKIITPIQPVLTPRQNRSITINDTQSNYSTITTTSKYNPLQIKPANESFTPINLENSNITFSLINSADHTFNAFSNHNLSPFTSQKIPLIIPRSETETKEQQLLPHHSFVFNSQQNNQDPPKAINSTHLSTRVRNKTNITLQNEPLPISDPKAFQTRPGKKHKHNIPKNNPTQNPIPKISTQENAEEMEAQGEKKRRREEETSDKTQNNVSEHFLAADILFLSETLSKAQSMERVRVNLKFQSCLSVDVEGRSGGLSVMWRDTIKCRVLNYSRNFINLIVEEKEGEEWRLTCYYGYPERGRRRQAWELLKELRDMSDLPWCIIGDFNDLLSQDDKKGTHPHPNWLCNGFRNAVSDCDLTDIQLEGYPYTWIKSRGSPNVIEERLDRAMVNPEWLMIFPKAKLLNLLASHSDHSPILLQNTPMVRHGKTYSFRFENIWLKEDDVEEVVVAGWGRERGIDITSRTSRCADKLQGWGRRKRMRWIVGDGTSIKVMTDPWLRGEEGAWISSPQIQEKIN